MSSIDSQAKPAILLSLSDSQHDVVMRAAAALHEADREPFINAVACRLSGEAVGDGSVARAVRDLIGTGAYRRLLTVAVGAGARETRWSKTAGA
jgi:hypothetical protein